MAFSATLTLNDLNDYLAPSQACIRPVDVVEAVEQEEGAKTEITIDSTGEYYEMTLPRSLPSTVASKPVSEFSDFASTGREEKKKLKKAEISLNDCLACSGCITTSQELLLQTHSLTPLIALLPPNNPTQTIFLSISPQSLASLASVLPSPSPPLPILLHRLSHFLPSIGIHHVADLSFARHVSLSETQREFDERKRGETGGLPMLASACPGWVCYAEKAHGEVLDKVGRGRSAMGIMGALVKGWWARRQGLDSTAIFHVSVQPCYDRKLESSRTQFISSLTSQPETDLVLTTGELDSLLKERGFDPLAAVPGEVDLLARLAAIEMASLSASSSMDAVVEGVSSEGFPSMLTHPGSSSDAYLWSLIERQIARFPAGSLTLATTPIRGSPDYIEYTLSISADFDPSSSTTTTLPPSGTSVFRAAKCYGFKNLQNVVRKTKTSRLPTPSRAATAARRATPQGYDYVEVMACPSGCVNGGGQLKPPSFAGAAAAAATSPPVVKPKLDEEGFPRPWEANETALAQVPTPDSSPAVDVETRWSTKAWVARVEAIYWGKEPPPPDAPASMAPLVPTKGAVGPPSSIAEESDEEGRRRARVAAVLRWADQVEEGVREEMSRAQSGDGWVRTTYEALKPEDDGLLGSGVIW